MQVNTISYYEENAKSLISRYESADINEVQELLLQTFYKNSKLFEIGCGSGRDASFMTKNSCDVIAIDGSKTMIEEAKKIHPELSEKLFHKTLPNDLGFDKKIDALIAITPYSNCVELQFNKETVKLFVPDDSALEFESPL